MHGERQRGGAVLLVAVVLLAVMGSIGLAALQSTTRERRSAGFQNRSETAFYAAEAAVAHARALVRTVADRNDTPAFPSQAAAQPLGDAALYDREPALPVYYGDPAFPQPVRYAGDTGIYAGGGNLHLKGQKFTNTLWQINAAGQSPDGAVARVEVMETKILTSGY